MSVSNVYVISLKRSVERREKIAKEMAEKNIAFTFFDAVDGHLGEPELAADYDYRKRLWLTSGKMPNKGELGCYASHYALWLKCIELGEPIIICEDDIELHENAKSIVEYALMAANEYGFIRMQSVCKGSATTEVIKDGEFSLHLMRDNYGGLCAYAISPKAASRLIKHRWCFPVDCFVGANYIHGQYSYQLEPCFMADHIGNESTIQFEKMEKPPFYRKLSRELYTLYKKIMLSIMYWKKCRALNVK
ncbi:Lipooligosaccharide biosynthesis protein lex-1 [Grimontia hollisae]|uniref:Lipooligosaccharide biosynthesis protein lex-1 n=1 Tax=Grimontia hollisae TaxID=673 RepID=A0A377HLJ1_GRIHO|nr:Lipooligosaccharide biosynthesis protein lex-1 [Grimontia hollisae]STQ74750.1 Lipooligosaccharide biosynthesis protein lex-1 [Grimontia hollisae]